MTYTIVARCQRTGRLGIATASEVVSTGLYCDGAARSHVGATLTQAAPHPRNNLLALNLLAQGRTPANVLDELRANDPDFDTRQVAIIDREGNAAAHSGAHTPAWTGHRIGAGYVAMASAVANEAVLEPLRAAFGSGAGLDLEERLLKALEAARDGSGQPKARSVALVVFGNQPYSDVDLRVDWHDEPVGELRRLFDEYQPFAAYYVERAKNPRQALPQKEFADMLYARKAKEAP
jgi:uncharacterized Ntn-hydrolase superfamily protein